VSHYDVVKEMFPLRKDFCHCSLFRLWDFIFESSLFSEVSFSPLALGPGVLIFKRGCDITKGGHRLVKTSFGLFGHPT
jgi:hypothetical protein